MFLIQATPARCRFHSLDVVRISGPYLLSLLCVLHVSAAGYPSAAAEPSSAFSPHDYRGTHPATTEQVEAELRKKRQALRMSPAYRPHTAATHLLLAGILSQQGDPNGAIEEFQAALRLNPQSPEAWRGLGSVHLDKHEWRDAEEALKTSLVLAHEDAQASYWLGRALLAQRKFSAAATAFAAAAEFNQQDAESLADLGLVHMAEGRVPEAAEALVQAIQLKPDLTEAHHRLEILRAAQEDQAQLISAAREILDVLFRPE